jgi:hypothetical protein
MTPIERIKYRDHVIEVYHDDHAEDPTGGDGWLSTFSHWHRRYMFAKCAERGRHSGIVEDVQQCQDGSRVSIPVGMLDHSGVSLWEGTGHHPADAGGWDSGQVGFLWTDKDRVRQHLGYELTPETAENVREQLRQELKVLAAWVAGECYGYFTRDLDGEEPGDPLDNCFGFVGDMDYMLQEAKASIDQHFELVKHN